MMMNHGSSIICMGIALLCSEHVHTFSWLQKTKLWNISWSSIGLYKLKSFIQIHTSTIFPATPNLPFRKVPRLWHALIGRMEVFQIPAVTPLIRKKKKNGRLDQDAMMICHYNDRPGSYRSGCYIWCSYYCYYPDIIKYYYNTLMMIIRSIIIMECLNQPGLRRSIKLACIINTYIYIISICTCLLGHVCIYLDMMYISMSTLLYLKCLASQKSSKSMQFTVSLLPRNCQKHVISLTRIWERHLFPRVYSNILHLDIGYPKIW